MSRKSMFETHVQGFTPPTLLAHLDEEPTDILQWKRGVLFTSDAGNSSFDPSVSTRCIGAGQARGS